MLIHKEFSAEREPLCAFCVRNKHKECWKKEWDPHEPAATYAISRCGCVCEGRIGREYDSLRELAEHLYMQLNRSKDSERKQMMLASRAAGVADEALEAIRAFDTSVRDDEGNFTVSSRAGHVDSVIDSFLDKIRSIADKGQALISAIAGSETSEEAMEEAVQSLFNPSDEQRVREAERQKLLLNKDWPGKGHPQSTVRDRPNVISKGQPLNRDGWTPSDSVSDEGWPVD